jgi:hypothetical protein
MSKLIILCHFIMHETGSLVRIFVQEWSYHYWHLNIELWIILMPDKTQYSKPLPTTPITIFTWMQGEVLPLNLALKCEVVLNSHMKHHTWLKQTGSLWTGPCRAKPRPASPNHARSVLFWDITQSTVVIPDTTVFVWDFICKLILRTHNVSEDGSF